MGVSEILDRYCRNTGTAREEVLRKSLTDAVVIRRNALMYLTWQGLKETVCYNRKKKVVMTEIAETFGMTRHNAYEQISTFEFNLNSRQFREMLERIERDLG